MWVILCFWIVVETTNKNFRLLGSEMSYLNQFRFHFVSTWNIWRKWTIWPLCQRTRQDWVKNLLILRRDQDLQKAVSRPRLVSIKLWLWPPTFVCNIKRKKKKKRKKLGWNFVIMNKTLTKSFWVSGDDPIYFIRLSIFVFLLWISLWCPQFLHSQWT